MDVTVPEGATASLSFYLYSPTEDVEISVTVGPLFTISVEDVNLTRIVEQFKLGTIAKDWRLMTRDEIADYLKRERADKIREQAKHRNTLGLGGKNGKH